MSDAIDSDHTQSRPDAGTPEVTAARVLRLWLPLAGSWLLMGAEMPLVNAVIARLPDTDVQLAAFGSIVYPFSLLVEAPIIMLLAASTALSVDAASHRWLLRFTNIAGFSLTLVHAAVAFTPLFDVVARQLVDVPEPVVEPARLGLRIMLPWTWAIAFRRVQQGVLIRWERSRAVALGTVVRLLANASALTVGLAVGGLPGIAVGTIGIAAGVLAEAVWAGWCVERLARDRLEAAPAAEHTLTLGSFARFYVPLACTPLMTIAAQPLGAAAMARMPEALSSLAAWPPVHSLVFLTRSAGFAFHEVVVALIGRPGGRRALWQFAVGLAFVTMAILTLFAATPLGTVWFGTVIGMPAELAPVCVASLALAILMPGYQVLQSLWQGELVHARRTAPVTAAVAVYLALAAASLTFGVRHGGYRGIDVALVAFTIAGLGQTAVLWFAARRAARVVHGS